MHQYDVMWCKFTYWVVDEAIKGWRRSGFAHHCPGVREPSAGTSCQVGTNRARKKGVVCVGYARCGGKVRRGPVATVGAAQMTYGQRYSSSAFGNHGVRTLTRYQAGNGGSAVGVCNGLSISPAREGFARQTGFGVSLSRESYVHPRLLLASACGVRVGSAAEVTPGLLAAQTRSK